MIFGFTKHTVPLFRGELLGCKETTKTDKQIEYQDNTDRIEVEHSFFWVGVSLDIYRSDVEGRK